VEGEAIDVSNWPHETAMLNHVRRAVRRLLRLPPFEEGNTSWFYSGRIRYILNLFWLQLPSKPVNILDVGCSSGWFEQAVAELPDVSVTGLELDRKHAEIARSYAPQASIVRGSVLHLPFESETFDGAVMWEVIEHLPKASELLALREVYRVLKPGAFLLLSTPHNHPVVCALDPAWYLGHRHYSVVTLRRLLCTSGFNVDRVEVKGGMREVFGILRFYAYKWLLGAAVPPNTNADAEFAPGYHGIVNAFVVARRPPAQRS
jgi:SAM-dependent methyltransferase